jgi:hypothetical protein
MTRAEEMALLRAAEAVAAQRLLVASAAQKERDARAAAATSIRRCVNLLYEDVVAEPIPPRLGTLITQLETAAA